ncbi:hypothetical protein FN846DRAFT_905551 [Sphaerosporella brunnea]|uniref:C2H2-type domain-containing protein n=1 Tax=Sphaerosporella brunnea TaxID=1250544 RepID=A0A5J5F2E5_9PEZI|nr:hypothetical protein FN846DRAFT_905551 [Sphaerosporella brunnea]
MDRHDHDHDHDHDPFDSSPERFEAIKKSTLQRLRAKAAAEAFGKDTAAIPDVPFSISQYLPFYDVPGHPNYIPLDKRRQVAEELMASVGREVPARGQVASVNKMGRSVVDARSPSIDESPNANVAQRAPAKEQVASVDKMGRSVVDARSPSIDESLDANVARRAPAKGQVASVNKMGRTVVDARSPSIDESLNANVARRAPAKGQVASVNKMERSTVRFSGIDESLNANVAQRAPAKGQVASVDKMGRSVVDARSPSIDESLRASGDVVFRNVNYGPFQPTVTEQPAWVQEAEAMFDASSPWTADGFKASKQVSLTATKPAKQATVRLSPAENYASPSPGVAEIQGRLEAMLIDRDGSTSEDSAGSMLDQISGAVSGEQSAKHAVPIIKKEHAVDMSDKRERAIDLVAASFKLSEIPKPAAKNLKRYPPYRYKCTACRLIMSDEMELRRHYVLVKHDWNFWCEKCDTIVKGEHPCDKWFSRRAWDFTNRN